MLTVHPLGLLLAVIFAVSMGGLLWWMLRVPPYLPAPVAHARVAVESIRSILVPTLGATFAGREVELACRLGQDQKAQIVLAYVLEVPRTLPLGAAMPQAEEKANEALKLAKTIVDLHGLPSRTEILRARVAGERIAQAAGEEGVDLIVVGLKAGMNLPYETFARTVDILMKKAPCELLVNRVNADEESS